MGSWHHLHLETQQHSLLTVLCAWHYSKPGMHRQALCRWRSASDSSAAAAAAAALGDCQGVGGSAPAVTRGGEWPASGPKPGKSTAACITPGNSSLSHNNGGAQVELQHPKRGCVAEGGKHAWPLQASLRHSLQREW
jgi:hypothetical protein